MSLIESDKTSRNRLRLLVLAFGLMFALMPLLGQAQDGVVPSEPEVVEASTGTAMPSLWDLSVQGMIQAFMVISSTTSTGSAKAQELAHGIYTALVTTFAGLVVAVVAVLLANFLEGRLDRILRSMEELFLDLVPQFERYEGKLRVSRTQNDESGESGILLKGTARKTPVKTESTGQSALDDEPVSAGARPRSLWGVMGESENA